ncbi:bifunctional heptose 7-phosphate kinase/heptose 1-phosphate adenyltransferase [Malaciobacter molluscorum LMG 25693]|uniref:Bifunctional protein HldE n=1 Tax=Malaciobacter molluscorum LMG 25693 TaxID=870501 RepID=A0A2G1DFG8_9BACT|nr:D-glycero-beta-D-manno-heptose-7-phosphate kinase [Malaciobacter molluscorum]AXX91767.1 D,D-heptose 1-phosphate adenosyltransferase / D,D-heptose 7-phosphate kinase [Malaciobacter molluscorum LMG 25693]PHO17237.1 bifunctional heptose 7-phosphate kinase/heptose 1-phosphate adenyltransferase [Malaciobacter molluscorum LMG 25693]
MIKLDKKPNILVIGDLMIDHYLWGSCDRISPEAPVQIIDVKKETTVLGGAGNVINNLLSLGSDVGVISVVGDDEVAKELKSMLDKHGAKSFLIEQKGRKTSKKSRIMASHSQVVRYDHESKNSISFDSEKKIFEKFQELINRYDIILFSDYGKGVITKDLSKKIIDYAKKYDKKVIVDPKGEDYSKYSGAYFLTPNKKEAQIASKVEIENEEKLKEALIKLKTIASLDYSIITLSEQGIALLKDDEVILRPTVAREVFDVTGAGDTVLASLGFALSLGKDLVEAIEFANLAAGVVVGKLGSATVTLDEIEEYKTSLNQSSIEFHLKTFKEIEKISNRLKEQNKKIVFTNGCFDILHKGHVSYLNTAKSFGDVLILGLNSDDSVKRLKGENRPINNQDDRAYILLALECVDYVVIFDEDTPYELISLVKPDILVKGADYDGKEVVGSDIAKETKLVEFIDGRSTTKTIEKIQGK